MSQHCSETFTDAISLYVFYVVGPLIEELIFRKRIIDSVRVYGTGVAVVFSSVLFGLFHGNFEQMFY